MTHLVKRPTSEELSHSYSRFCRHCLQRGRGEQPAHFTTHTQYTRYGRLTWRVDYVCETHARQFAKRHGAELPA